uniref:Uncharacterized protein n=1 Tax=Siphoviridae sp. ctBCr48 TaxID=2827802 RepID=A0A8S5SHI4_9CAUD|nr:MAG TPA: hypothetical protein [Siphoviridae sp. ctBCr48]
MEHHNPPTSPIHFPPIPFLIHPSIHPSHLYIPSIHPSYYHLPLSYLISIKH